MNKADFSGGSIHWTFPEARSDHTSCRTTRQKEQKKKKRRVSLVVSAPHTVVEPAAVMVKVGNTLVTGTAVF